VALLTTAQPQALASGVEELPAPLRKIVAAFQMVPDPMMRYKQLLFYASKLKALPAAQHTPENKVQGCVSQARPGVGVTQLCWLTRRQVWVVPELREGLVYFQADSDSALTKGLAALLVEGLSGCAPAEVLGVTPAFIEALGLKQSLTPSRNNGFLNMLKLMQRKTADLVSTTTPAAAAPAPAGKPVYSAITAKLAAALTPSLLEVTDESSGHSGHAGVGGKRGETHFRVRVESEAFAGLGQVARHRLVYAALSDEFAAGLHALTIEATTRAE